MTKNPAKNKRQSSVVKKGLASTARTDRAPALPEHPQGTPPASPTPTPTPTPSSEDQEAVELSGHADNPQNQEPQHSPGRHSPKPQHLAHTRSTPTKGSSGAGRERRRRRQGKRDSVPATHSSTSDKAETSKPKEAASSARSTKRAPKPKRVIPPRFQSHSASAPHPNPSHSVGTCTAAYTTHAAGHTNSVCGIYHMSTACMNMAPSPPCALCAVLHERDAAVAEAQQLMHRLTEADTAYRTLHYDTVRGYATQIMCLQEELKAAHAKYRDVCAQLELTQSAYKRDVSNAADLLHAKTLQTQTLHELWEGAVRERDLALDKLGRERMCFGDKL